MPGGDGTGPMGQGPMTGWGRQAAAGRAESEGRSGAGRGMGRGQGRGRGRGWRHIFRQTGLTRWQRTAEQTLGATAKSSTAAATPDATPPLETLRQREQELAAELREIQTQIERQTEDTSG